MAPTAGATGTRAAHIQLKPRRRGNPPVPVMKPRHKASESMGHTITSALAHSLLTSIDTKRSVARTLSTSGECSLYRDSSIDAGNGVCSLRSKARFSTTPDMHEVICVIKQKNGHTLEVRPPPLHLLTRHWDCWRRACVELLPDPL